MLLTVRGLGPKNGRLSILKSYKNSPEERKKTQITEIKNNNSTNLLKITKQNSL